MWNRRNRRACSVPSEQDCSIVTISKSYAGIMTRALFVGDFGDARRVLVPVSAFFFKGALFLVTFNLEPILSL